MSVRRFITPIFGEGERIPEAGVFKSYGLRIETGDGTLFSLYHRI
jgi:hypothetical protein